MVSNFKIQNMSLQTKQVSKSSPMFNFIPTSRILHQFKVSFLPITRLHCLSLSSSPVPLPNHEIPPIEHPFKVSYVINTFGWPPEIAITKTKFINFDSPEKPESVLAFLKNHVFSKTQISRIVKNYPQLLTNDPKILLPKLKFLSNLGLSGTEVADVVTKAPRILSRSLGKTVIPNFNLVSDLLNSNDEAVKMVKLSPNILTTNPDLDNVQILLEAGVPGYNIVVSRRQLYKGYKHSPESYRKMVEEVKEMGFDPCRIVFMLALRNIMSFGKSSWKDKTELLKKYGWSDRDILLAFQKNPKFIEYSKDKIDEIMDFLVNRMGIKATDVANWPVIFCYSIKKRIVPRFLVYQSMIEKGLCKKNIKIVYVCNLSEDQFLAKITKQCEGQAPELLEFYKEMLGVKKLT